VHDIRAGDGTTQIVNINPSDLLTQLSVAHGTAFNSREHQHDPTCLQNTRVGLLRESQRNGNLVIHNSIFWLNGGAGFGRFTIARPVATLFSRKGVPLADFFFTRGRGDVGNAQKFCTTSAI